MYWKRNMKLNCLYPNRKTSFDTNAKRTLGLSGVMDGMIRCLVEMLEKKMIRCLVKRLDGMMLCLLGVPFLTEWTNLRIAFGEVPPDLNQTRASNHILHPVRGQAGIQQAIFPGSLPRNITTIM
ncbi:hypothetical protein DPMN_073124 [Dreissena polymorpha]|uniref:Uncharacterized protein n=1 Tax=Dreissena polymorpha TaxID=45954 RepID=A0A9D4BYG7_DREPO|nr:hypothetical protein DPMN_073124 [Dreissena polymorpha]